MTPRPKALTLQHPDADRDLGKASKTFLELEDVEQEGRGFGLGSVPSSPRFTNAVTPRFAKKDTGSLKDLEDASQSSGTASTPRMGSPAPFLKSKMKMSPKGDGIKAVRDAINLPSLLRSKPEQPKKTPGS